MRLCQFGFISRCVTGGCDHERRAGMERRKCLKVSPQLQLEDQTNISCSLLRCSPASTDFHDCERLTFFDIYVLLLIKAVRGLFGRTSSNHQPTASIWQHEALGKTLCSPSRFRASSERGTFFEWYSAPTRRWRKKCHPSGECLACSF